MNPLICARCGARTDTPIVNPQGTMLNCRDCGHNEPFRRLPLLSLTGPSGTGKSTVARRLVDRSADRVVVLEQDVLWLGGLRDPAENHRMFRSAWLRLASMIQQSGRPALLCGTVAPPEFEPLPERALFTEIHYLALTCAPAVLADRLRARPAWRAWTPSRITETLEYNDWIRATAESMNMHLLDTTDATVESATEQVRVWVDTVLASDEPPGEHRPRTDPPSPS